MDFKAFIIDPNDITRILFGAGGKLSPMEFAQGLVFIVLAGIAVNFLSLVPGLGLIMGIIGLVVGLVLMFGWICIFSKRFHDAGKSGWMTLLAILSAIVIGILTGLILGPLFGLQLSAEAGYASYLSMSPGRMFQNVLQSVIVNGALGYYMFNLKPVAAD